MRTTLKYLLKDLIYNIEEYKQYEKEGAHDSGFFSFIGRDQTTTDTAWSRFINTLCHLPYQTNAHYQLIHSLKDYYKNDNAKLR